METNQWNHHKRKPCCSHTCCWTQISLWKTPSGPSHQNSKHSYHLNTSHITFTGQSPRKNNRAERIETRRRYFQPKKHSESIWLALQDTNLQRWQQFPVSIHMARRGALWLERKLLQDNLEERKCRKWKPQSNGHHHFHGPKWNDWKLPSHWNHSWLHDPKREHSHCRNQIVFLLIKTKVTNF